ERDLRVEDHLQDEVADLLAKRGEIAGVDRFERLVRLLEEVARERGVCLLAVPRAPARRAQLRHDLDERAEGLAGRFDEPFRDVVGQVGSDRIRGDPRAPGRHGRNVPALWTTTACERSKRPYCGLTMMCAPRT